MPFPDIVSAPCLRAPQAIEGIVKILDNLQICPARTGQIALAWAIPNLPQWRAENRADILTRAGIFTDVIARHPGWKVESIGAYFAYLRHPWPGTPAATVAERLARERGVLALPGSYFGPDQENFLRVAFANVEIAAGRSSGCATGRDVTHEQHARHIGQDAVEEGESRSPLRAASL